MALAPAALLRAIVDTHRQARWSPERQRAWVDARLRAVVRDAADQIAFYRDHFADHGVDAQAFRGL
ncbi:MAG TPA: hypothetical protein QF361_08960, partial [Gammaproteobacteria bacterium]|nr:hypothetical protein [Gammaproteobacteria bacterium]